MLDRRALSTLGSHVYGLGAIALGLVGLVWGKQEQHTMPMAAAQQTTIWLTL
jgi:hypothetical protein